MKSKRDKSEKSSLPENFLMELDRRYEEYKKDGKGVSRSEMDKRIRKLLKRKW